MIPESIRPSSRAPVLVGVGVRPAVAADPPDGTGTAATCEDAAIAHATLTESLIGRTVHFERAAFSL